MATTSQVKAGRAYVEIGVDSAALQKGLQAAARKLSAFGQTVREIGTKVLVGGAALLTPLLTSARAFADVGSQLSDMSRRTGVSASALSELAYAAKLSGSDLEGLEDGLRKMQRTVVQAASGSEQAKAALAALGVSAEDLLKLKPEEQMEVLADRLTSISDPTLRAALAMQVFGKSGTMLLPLLLEGSKGIEEMRKRARDLGLTFSKESADAADAFGDKLDEVWMVLRRASAAVGEALVPVLTRLIDAIERVVVGAIRWVQSHQDVVVLVFEVATGTVAAGAALIGLGYALSGIAGIFSTLAAAVGAASTVVGYLGAALGLLVTPIGAAVAAVVALGAYVLYATGAGGKALSWLGERFAELKDAATASFRGVADALMAGNVALAARVLWLSLRLAWQVGIGELERLWTAFTTWFVKAAFGAYYGALAAADDAWHGMKVAWIEGVAFLKSLWTTFSSWHASAVQATADAMVEAWISAKKLLDKNFDADFARSYAAKESDRQKAEIGRQKKADLGSAEQDRQSARQQEAKRHEDRQAEIGKGYEDAAKAAEDERTEKLRKAQADLDKAKAEWQAAIEEARKKRAGTKDGDPLPPKPDLPDLSGVLPALAGKTSIRTAGTFSALEAAGIGAGGVADKIANATAATAKNTSKLVEMARDGDTPFD